MHLDLSRQLESAARSALAQSREVLVGLRQQDDSAPLVQAVADRARRWSERSGIPTAFTNAGVADVHAANRIAALRVLDEARVTPEALDVAMKNGAGWPMGPCTLVDLVGIDVHVHAAEALYERLREPRMAPPPRLVAMKNAGLLGRKSGRGFYSY